MILAMRGGFGYTDFTQTKPLTGAFVQMTVQQTIGLILLLVVLIGGVAIVIRVSTSPEARLRRQDRKRRKRQEQRYRERLERCPRCWRRTLRVKGDQAYCQSTGCAYSRGSNALKGGP